MGLQYRERYTDMVDRGPDLFFSIARPETMAGVNAKSDVLPDVRAVIDTGAQLCVIRQSLADDLGLQPHDERNFGNSTCVERRPIYLVDLILKDDVRRKYEAAGCDFHGQSIEFLLGRNFLAHSKLTYDGTVGSYELEVVSPPG